MASAFLDAFSIKSLYIELLFDDFILSHGTATLWLKQVSDKEAKCFLVTNWHNFSGRNFFDGKCLSKELAVPKKFRIYFRTQKIGIFCIQEFPLYDADDAPLWFELPAASGRCDLVSYHISVPNEALVAFANRSAVEGDRNADNMEVGIGSDVFIVGFPFKLKEQNLPVWKRASVATELDVSRVGEKRYFLVDTASRPGMSGSLVIARRWGPYLDESGDLIMHAGISDRIVGIYSGRVGGKDDLQLGIVWPIDLLQVLLDNPRKAENPDYATPIPPLEPPDK